MALNAKGGEINKPKQKDCTTTLFSENFCFLQKFAFAKTLLPAKGRTFSGGSFYLAKGKAFEKGENLSKLENALEIIFLYHWLIAKEFEKTFPKDLQKQAKWCKCGQYIKTIIYA